LARSRIKRDRLKAGTAAPEFRLPRLDGRGELSLSELRGRQVLLVFYSPDCGPCNVPAPRLEQFHRSHPELEIVMISRGEKDNRAKVKEHGLSFSIVLQQQWEISGFTQCLPRRLPI
jgi:peroxiredoxin